MSNLVVVLSVAVAISTGLAIRLTGQAAPPERQLVTRAAEALGGRDRVMALKTLQIVGYGELAYFNGGGNITAAAKDLVHPGWVEHGLPRVPLAKWQ